MRYFFQDTSPYIGTVQGGSTPGGYVTIEPFNRNVAELQAVVHNVDRDNFVANLVDETLIDAGVFHTVDFEEVFTDQTLTLTDQAMPGVMMAVPDAAGDPWAWSIDMGDGFLRILLRVQVTYPAGGNSLYLGVLVNGVLVGRSPTFAGVRDLNSGGQPTHTLTLSTAVPVGSGTARIEPVLFATRTPASGVSFAFTVGPRAQFTRSVLR